MRKIEQQMVAAINKRKRFSSGNTQVEETENGVIVKLHGNKICEVGRDTIVINDGGWESNTTKSRLNVILRDVIGGGWGIYQKNFQWYLAKNGEVDAIWESGATFDTGGNLLAII